jgi:hypothetical protein
MNVDLNDEESAALLAEIDRIIDGDRYPFSPRIRTLTAVRDKLRPPPVREPLPPLRSYAPPSERQIPELGKASTRPPMTLGGRVGAR